MSGESVVALIDQGLQALMGGVAGLNQYFAGHVAAPGAACHLRQQLRHEFLAPKIGAEQAAVGVQHTCQRYGREVMAFGDHLGADQNTGLRRLNLGQQAVELILAAGRVTVDADDARTRKVLAQRQFNALGASANCISRFALTVRAVSHHWLFALAMVTAKVRWPVMYREAGVAMGALGDPAAVLALQNRREAASIDEHQRLLAPRQMLPDSFQQA